MARDLKILDPSGMDGHLRGLHQQVREMGQLSVDIPAFGELRALMFLGMGGSAIAGGLTAGLIAAEAPCPVLTIGGYQLPQWAGKGVVGIAVSHSGNTEETLAASRQLRSQGGAVIGITSGGALAEDCHNAGECTVAIPSGMPPRASFGFLAGATLRVAHQLSFIADPDLSTRADRLEAFLDQLLPEPGGTPDGLLADLADTIEEDLPLFIAPDGFLASVAYRWTCQLNENAKRAARHVVLPECNHNEVVSWMGPGLAPAILFDDPSVDARVRYRLDVSEEILGDAGARTRRVVGDGPHLLDRALSLVALGDALSLELAYRKSIDPTPIPQIDRLKHALAEKAQTG